MTTTTTTFDPAVHVRLDREKVPYKNSEGKRVPGVTTVNANLSKPALVDWAAELEREAVLGYCDEASASCDNPRGVADATRTLVAHFLGNRYAHSVARQHAADVGHIAHGRIAAFLSGKSLWTDDLPPDAVERSVAPFQRFLAWKEDNGFTSVASELSIVDDDLGVGGTLDWLAIDRDGRLVLVDFKTSKASSGWPYDETFAQVAAYEHLANLDEVAAREPVSRVIVLRLGKDEREWMQERPVSPAELEAGWALFQGALAVHNARNALARAKRAGRAKKGA